MHQRREFEKQSVPSAVVGTATRPPSETFAQGSDAPLYMASSTCRPHSLTILAAGSWTKRCRAIPGRLWFMKADNFDDTEHLPSPLLLQVRR
ncbi:unnamed protein product [Heligmosomoides polygyrus]|uniref:Uncharacterized protein n=1 Tax=Heligmosomoides polygyrus TaxID=6339 RepID=A0A183GJK9_HELPZ|nr:unnamed protein product [Heligmosomoides polygyrus]